MGLQKLIGLAEMPAPKEPPVCRQGAWMGCLQDQVLGVSQHRAFLLGGPAPQHGYNWPVLGIDSMDNGVRKLFPALPLMGIGLMGTDGKYRI